MGIGAGCFLRAARVIDPERGDGSSIGEVGYPFDIPAVRALADEVTFGDITVFVGENGSGKSTIVEAIAVTTGFNAEGGGRNLRFETLSTHSELSERLTLRWRRRPHWGWFLRAESFYGMASHIARDEDLARHLPDLHGGSHGESFLALIDSRFDRPGFYVMDEPESALSFRGQLSLLRAMHDGVALGSQFVLATHSPVLMRAPGAVIYEVGDDGIRRTDYDDLAVVRLWRRFLDAPERMLDVLLADP